MRIANAQWGNAIKTQIKGTYSNGTRFVASVPTGEDLRSIESRALSSALLSWVKAGNAVAGFRAPAPPDYRDIRAFRYSTELSDGSPLFHESLGDTIDAMQKELRRVGVAVGGKVDPEFAAKTRIIDRIKSEVPKP